MFDNDERAFCPVNVGALSTCVNRCDRDTASQNTTNSFPYRRHRARHPDPLHASTSVKMAPTDVDIIPVEGGLHVLLQAFVMIIFSEIGDKTFLIAAILAMRHPRIVVFAGAISSLAVMSTLSAAMGHVLPSLIPKQWTQLAAAVLFLVFGAKMAMEARNMKSGNEKIKEEMREAEEDIDNDEATGHDDDDIPLQDIETGGGGKTPVRSRSTTVITHSWRDGARNFCNFFLGPVFVQAFVLTFLGEWGDRSQIATIALGAAHVRPSVASTSAPFRDRLTPSPERLHHYLWDHRRTRILHGPRGHRGSVCINQDLCQAWFVVFLDPRWPSVYDGFLFLQ